MNDRRIVVAATALALASMIGVSCGSSGEVRSDNGPALTATRSSEDSTSDQTTSTAAKPASSTTSDRLAIVGTVQVPEGQPGKLSVAALGPPVISMSTKLPVLVRNLTGDTLYGIEATGTARAADGSLIGSGSSQGFAPEAVAPGEWAFGFVFFSNELPADATFDVTVTGRDDDGFLSSVDVLPTEVNLVPGQFSDQIVGIVSNDTGEEVSGPVSVDVACFDAAGTTITSVHGGYTDGDSIPAGGTASFSVDLYDDAACPNYAVGASGYNY